ncbi:MAG: hypothetical protein HUU38_25955 [Anaerolineales bacterium]|nr:hypothetical protein [Anaerolineales bacterium]
MKTPFFAFFFLLTTFLLFGCSNTPVASTQDTLEPQNEFVASQFPNIRMNIDLRLAVLEDNNPLKINFPAFLMLENLSKKLLLFDPETDIYVFLFNGSEYVPIDDNMAYGEPSEENLSATGKSGSITGFSVDPAITETDQPAQLLVVVVSTVKSFGMKTDEKVGAYLELILPP